MKKSLLLLAVLAIATVSSAQKIAIKNNIAANATASLNIGVECSLGKRNTMDVYLSYNPFTFSNNRKFKHFLVMPELRFWTCESFNGLFFGLHGFGGIYNIGRVYIPTVPTVKDFRYQGDIFGGGVSVGFQWILGHRWNFEAALGGGLTYINYTKYNPERQTAILFRDNLLYLGLTRVSLAIVFFFN